MNIPKYIELALEIKATNPGRDHYLIAEWCIDILPASRYKVRQLIRRKIIEALEGE